MGHPAFVAHGEKRGGQRSPWQPLRGHSGLVPPKAHTMVSMTTGLPLGVLELDGQPLSLDQVSKVATGSMSVAIAPGARQRIAASQAVVERIVTSNETAYGINTGFGKLSDVRIGIEDLQQLQRNLVRSHACGLGEPLEEAEVRAMLLLRANVLTPAEIWRPWPISPWCLLGKAKFFLRARGCPPRQA
jgi:hypothetical protein